MQSQWELASVEVALHRVLATPNASPKLLAEAKKVVADVDAVVEELEAGKLQDPATRKAKVGSAIQALAGLEKEWAQAPVRVFGRRRSCRKVNSLGGPDAL